MTTLNAVIRGLTLGFVTAAAALTALPAGAEEETVGPVLRQPSMNVFRRFAAEDPVPLFDYYAKVLGHASLTTYDVGGGTGVSTFAAGDGASQLKFTARTQGRQYQPGGMDNATGIRLWTFFYSDRDALTGRFTANGLAAPEFEPVGDSGQLSAIVKDPEGQLVQLIITGDPVGTTYNEIEVGLVVSDLDASRAFYRDFVGLEELEPVHDPVFATTKYPYRHGTTTLSLRYFGAELPADTGTGGIQYVVSDVEFVDKLARERAIAIDQPLSTLPGFGLRTIWLDDPDGITNYFAQTGVARAPRQ
jgi:catechol 2,3-dioxygenase-like lactoylglutathione lyase family enzyme